MEHVKLEARSGCDRDQCVIVDNSMTDDRATDDNRRRPTTDGNSEFRDSNKGITLLKYCNIAAAAVELLS